MIVAGCPVLPLETGAGGLFRGFSRVAHCL